MAFAYLIAIVIGCLLVPFTTAQVNPIFGYTRFEASIEYRTSLDSWLPLYGSLLYDYESQRERIQFIDNSPLYASPNATTIQLRLMDSVRFSRPNSLWPLILV